MGRCGRRDSLVRVESDKETAWDSSLEDENEDVCGALRWRQLNRLNAPTDLLQLGFESLAPFLPLPVLGADMKSKNGHAGHSPASSRAGLHRGYEKEKHY